MKKILTILVCLVLGLGAMSARSRVVRDTKVLPQKAQAMLRTNFPKAQVNHIKLETKAFGRDEYDVILNDGTEVEFNHDGDWKEVDCGVKAVPASLVMPVIGKYVRTNYPSATIVGIEIDRRSYEVKLSNGVDLKFGRDGHFIKVD